MRTQLAIAALALVGCNWTEFDDLADSTWVRSTDDAHVGSRNYGLAIVGLSTTNNGGLLGVVSDDSPDYSTIDYGADGADRSGTNDLKLNQHRIAALSDPPLFVSDGNGKFALAERSTTGGNVAVVFGSATAPAGLDFPAASGTPDTIVFAGANVVVSAGNTFYTLLMGMQVPCSSPDTAMGVAATASDGTSLWVWAKSGAFFSVPLASLTPCTGGMLPAATSTFTTTSFMPANGAQIHLVGNYAILTGHPANSRQGQAFVVDTTTMTQADMVPVEGLRTSTVATFGGSTYLFVGVPDRAVDGVVAGQVDALELSTAGKLSTTPVMSLTDAQPESGGQFGRSVTTMKFNDKTVLVVAGNSEVFAYYKTALYDALP